MAVEANGGDTTLESQKVSVPYEERLKTLNNIAQPLAGKKLTKKIYKLIRKAKKTPKSFSPGLRPVQHLLRKKTTTGIVILAGDVTPIDMYSHIPALCEDQNIPYCYVPSREDIGLAMGVNRGVICVCIAEQNDYKELFDEVKTEIESLPIPYN